MREAHLRDFIAVIETGKNYVTLHDSSSGRSFPLRGTLTYVLDHLLPISLRSHFLRVNRCTSVNAAFITHYDEEWVYYGDHRYETTTAARRELRERMP